ncbi:hypothetical protein [Actinomadura sp. WMMA1423]|uniref:ACP S-malonyltransferase n=1 Tax=Actinomadura sp. WMMA1423 TaxID=2591108 RepID=UPI001F0E5E40|nr:hypothetical protein [Actinomadura sp. WMMA1423]
MGRRMETGQQDTSAIVFPGMGPVPFADVGRFMVLDRSARRLVAEADAVLGRSLVDGFRDTPGDYSEYAQVAFLVNCLAAADRARTELGADPVVCAGPSFGGKAAAVASGALGFADAVTMTLRWARLLEEYAARECPDVVTHSFARTPAGVFAGILAELGGRGGWHETSCQVDDDFHMVTVRERDLPWLCGRVRAAGGLPLYAMRPPMHTTVLGPLRDEVEREVFAELSFTDPLLPVIADQDGRTVRTAEGVRAMLLDGFVRTVRWPAVVAALKARGVGTLYVAGPDALFGRVRCTTDAFRVVPVDPKALTRPRGRGTARTAGAGTGAARGAVPSAGQAVSATTPVSVRHSTPAEAKVSGLSESSTKRTP